MRFTHEFISPSLRSRSCSVVLLRTSSTADCTACHRERTEQSTERVQTWIWPACSWQKCLDSKRRPPSLRSRSCSVVLLRTSSTADCTACHRERTEQSTVDDV